MQAIVWWTVPLVAFVLAIVWVSVANRPRPPVDPHDSVAEHERFREAMGRSVGDVASGRRRSSPARRSRRRARPPVRPGRPGTGLGPGVPPLDRAAAGAASSSRSACSRRSRCRVPYVVVSPGPAVNVLGSLAGKPLITISGAPTYPTDGRMDLTTVSESGGPYGRVPLTRVVGGWLDPTVAVVPTAVLYPSGETAQQVEQREHRGDAAVAGRGRHRGAAPPGLPVTLTVTVGVGHGGRSQPTGTSRPATGSCPSTAHRSAPATRSARAVAQAQAGRDVTFVRRSSGGVDAPCRSSPVRRRTTRPSAMVGFLPRRRLHLAGHGHDQARRRGRTQRRARCSRSASSTS